ncbi:uncharacterized protein ACA1_010500 [Acanthamoeba castellanii str. Neff]|uniref:Uncharacterized protein n=1 Tax=Acanthamoeba castellanii (strain ATCC 30010 / Neff) TaxID=1257118 RepID=L8GVW4_ACACF|nr:uncharacterized protein ACA1_010500 [Acanthamoeba castellanii str. Neff]ELR16221.1 hypothetical protein ACA1_010500 [Acanthamoeba castellanii str. Neff]
MKRVQEDDEKKTESGGSPCALRHHNEAPTKKKARLSPDENDATAPPAAVLNAHGAACTLVLSDLPDLVLYHLVRPNLIHWWGRELAVGDAIRLRATSSFWADQVVRNHPLARFVLVDLLPRFASLPPHRHDEEDRKNESESESETEDRCPMTNEEEDEEDLEAELAWILADAAEAARLADAEKKHQPWGRLGNPMFYPGIGGHDGYQGLGVSGRRLQLSSEETTVSRRVDERWELLQAVRIAADARLHELRLRSRDFWRDVASSDVRLQLSETEAFSLAQECNHHELCYMAVSCTYDSGGLDESVNLMSGSLEFVRCGSIWWQSWTSTGHLGSSDPPP